MCRSCYFLFVRRTIMKKYLIVFFSVTAFSALTAYAAIDKACYKRCMEKMDDKEKCEKICDKDKE